MKYGNRFHTKRGFADGDTVPSDAHLLRQANSTELTRLLQKHKSSVRPLRKRAALNESPA